MLGLVAVIVSPAGLSVASPRPAPVLPVPSSGHRRPACGFAGCARLPISHAVLLLYLLPGLSLFAVSPASPSRGACQICARGKISKRVSFYLRLRTCLKQFVRVSC